MYEYCLFVSIMFVQFYVVLLLLFRWFLVQFILLQSVRSESSSVYFVHYSTSKFYAHTPSNVVKSGSLLVCSRHIYIYAQWRRHTRWV